MAARIPGFDSYTQNHVTPLTDVGSRDPEPFEGIAIVTFVDEAHRQGLVDSKLTRHIHRDEQNVFRRALLYNLGPGARRPLSGQTPTAGGVRTFLVDRNTVVSGKGVSVRVHLGGTRCLIKKNTTPQ